MAELIGKQIELGVAVENARGVAETTASKWVKKITANIVEKATKTVDESTRNVLADSLGARVTQKWVEGDIEGNLHADVIGYFFYGLFGSEAVSEVQASTVYDHTFTMDNTITHPSLSIFGKDGSAYQNVFSNCMIGSLELTASPDSFVKFTASIIGKEATANTDTASYDTEYDFIGRDVVIKIADTLNGLAQATAIPVKEFNVTFDKGLVADYVLGSYNPDDIYNTQMNIEGEVTLNLSDATYKTLMLGDTYKYMSVAITGTQTIGSASNPTITFTFYRVSVLEWSRDDNASELVPQTIKFKAFYNETDSSQAQVVLRNLTDKYDPTISA